MVDARAGPGFKLTKPKKVKNIDAKKKSKLKHLHKFKRQSEFFLKHCVCTVHFNLKDLVILRCFFLFINFI